MYHWAYHNLDGELEHGEVLSLNLFQMLVERRVIQADHILKQLSDQNYLGLCEAFFVLFADIHLFRAL